VEIYTCVYIRGMQQPTRRNVYEQEVEDLQDDKHRAERIRLAEAYDDVLDLDSVDDPAVREYLKRGFIRKASQYNRLVANARRLKYIYRFNKTNNIVSCFKFSMGKLTSIYGYLYSRCVNDTFIHEYVCTGPTFTSQDGEYRGRIIPWWQYDRNFRKGHPAYERVEKLIVQKLETGQLTYHVDFYIADLCRSNFAALERDVIESRFAIRFHIMCWIVDMHEIHQHTNSNHMNTAYETIIYQRADIPVLLEILDSMDIKQYIILKNQISWYDSGVIDHLKDLGCGQKTFPVTSLEMTKLDNINYPIWREIYITAMASNMVLNLISPTFPLIGTWFYIANTGPGLFDNSSMHTRYKQSAVAGEINVALQRVDALNYDRESRNILGNKFLRMSKDMHGIMQYASENIRIIDTAMCMTMEYVGRTLRDVPRLISGRELKHGTEHIFADSHAFHKHMFEYVYAIVCMNTRMGAIHGDLHLNNVTMFRLYNFLRWPSAHAVRPEQLHVVYTLARGPTYIFPHFGVFSCIIDFSRAILGSRQLLEHSFGVLFTELYLSEQRGRFISTVRKNLPWLMEKYDTEVARMTTDNFALAFKILSAMDVYTLMRGIETLIETEALFRDKVSVTAAALPLVRSLISASREIMSRNFQAVMEGKLNDADDIEWPCMELLRGPIFSEYLLTPARMADPNIVVCDIFNHNNEVKYDFMDPSLWGPLLEIDSEQDDAQVARSNTYRDFDEEHEKERIIKKYAVADDPVQRIDDWNI